jgi:hypothetical protein
MGAFKDIFDFCTKLRGEVGDRNAGEATGEIEAPALTATGTGAIEEKHAKLFTEIAGLNRRLLDMEIIHKQAMAAFQETQRAETAKITAGNPNPAGELDLKTLDILKYIFKRAGKVTEREIARHFQMELNAASYHTYLLWKKKYIGSADAAVVEFRGGWDDETSSDDHSARYEITAAGRKCVVKTV